MEAPFISSSLAEVSEIMNTMKPTVQVSGPYGVQDTLRDGFRSVPHELAPRHPLQAQLAKAFSYKINC